MGFDVFIGIIILINSVFIGVETEMNLRGITASKVWYMEYVFAVIYVIELGLRFFAHHLRCLNNNWVVFDCFLVLISFFSIGADIVAYNQGLEESAGGSLQVVKMLRLTRLLRTVRLIAQFRMLWLLIRGLLSTVSLMVNTVFLMGLVLFVYACIGVELIAKDEDLMSDEFYAERFDSFPSIMLTLFQIVWFDDASKIYYRLVKQRAFLLLYFLSFIMMVSVALMNLLTAIVVEGSFEQARNDREVAAQSKKRLLTQVLPRIWNLIKVIDDDESGEITLEELRTCPEWVQDELTIMVSSDNIEELFNIMDVEDSGCVPVEEFFDGICKIATTGTPIEQMRSMKQINLLRYDITDLHKELDEMKLEAQQATEERHRMLDMLQNIENKGIGR